MDQDLDTYDKFEVKKSFEIEYKGQNVKNTLEFKKWYEGGLKYMKYENKRRSDAYIHDMEMDFNYISILSI